MAEELLADSQDRRCTAAPILDQLPEVFSLKEIQALREKNGQSSEVRVLLTRYCRNGKIERVGRGIYRKRMLHVSETKKGNNNMYTF